MLVGSQTRVASYGASGKKATTITVRLFNLDSDHQRKFPEDWSIGQPVRVIPNDEAVTINGVTYPPNTTYLDAKNPANPEPAIFLSSVYSGKAEQMLKAGCPESELPERDVRGLDGLIFDFELKDEPFFPGSKESTKRMVPVKYHGRASKQQLEAALAAISSNGNGHHEGNTPVSGDAALVAATATIQTQPGTNAEDAKAKFLAELTSRAAAGPVSTKDLTKIIVELFANDDAAKRALVTVFVNPVAAKAAVESVGLKHTGTEITL